MKKIILTLVATMFITLNANAQGIGYVDYDTITKNYSLSKKYNQTLQTKVKAIEAYSNQKQKEMNNAKSTNQKQTIATTAGKELDKKQKEYLALRDKYQAELTKNINSAVERVRVQKKLDIILNKKTVVSGGIDITQNVLVILK